MYDLERVGLHGVGLDVLLLAVAGPQVLGQVGQLRRAHILHGAVEDVVRAGVVGRERLGHPAAAADLDADAATLDRALLEQEVWQEIAYRVDERF